MLLDLPANSRPGQWPAAGGRVRLRTELRRDKPPAPTFPSPLISTVNPSASNNRLSAFWHCPVHPPPPECVSIGLPV